MMRSLTAKGPTSMADDLGLFLDTWREFGQRAAQGEALTLPIDRDVISRWGEKAVSRHSTWADVIRDPCFGADVDRRLQIGLVPQPFMGNLEAAKVVIVLLNPGLGPADFHAEFEHPTFRAALLQNLRGELVHSQFPFLFLDPTWAWTGGYSWWYARLRRIIACFEEKAGSRREAQSFVARNIASLELVPYHSQKEPRGYPDLPSVGLAKRAAAALQHAGKKIVVVRGHQHWALPEVADQVLKCPPSRGVRFPLRESEEGEHLAGDFIVQALREGN
jgi:hypothetical protein